MIPFDPSAEPCIAAMAGEPAATVWPGSEEGSTGLPALMACWLPPPLPTMEIPSPALEEEWPSEVSPHESTDDSLTNRLGSLDGDINEMFIYEFTDYAYTTVCLAPEALDETSDDIAYPEAAAITYAAAAETTEYILEEFDYYTLTSQFNSYNTYSMTVTFNCVNFISLAQDWLVEETTYEEHDQSPSLETVCEPTPCMIHPCHQSQPHTFSISDYIDDNSIYPLAEITQFQLPAADQPVSLETSVFQVAAMPFRAADTAYPAPGTAASALTPASTLSSRQEITVLLFNQVDDTPTPTLDSFTMSMAGPQQNLTFSQRAAQPSRSPEIIGSEADLLAMNVDVRHVPSLDSLDPINRLHQLLIQARI